MKKFGDGGKKVVLKELTQLHDKMAYVPVDPKKLNSEQKSKALQLICLLTEKQDGTIKAR